MTPKSQWAVKFLRQGIKVPLKFDRESDVNILLLNYLNKMKTKTKIKPIKIRLKSYTGDIVPVASKVDIITQRHPIKFLLL